MAKKKPIKHLGLRWQTMKIGQYLYEGTYEGAKSNVCRANRRYAPKRWKTYTTARTKNGVVYRDTYIERLTDAVAEA